MTSPELLRFFHTEASEYLDALQALVEDAVAAPDAGGLVAAARALRGSATMARAARVAEIALLLERLANALRDGEAQWSAVMRDEVEETLDDLRALVRATGQWGTREESRAAACVARLQRHAPNDSPRLATPAPASNTAPIFIALQASAIAGDLERFVTDPGDRRLLDDVITRLRSLRGIAGIVDHPPLAEVSDTVERGLRELAPDTVLLPRDSELLAAAAAVFRRASSDLRTRGRFATDGPELPRFARAAAEAPPAGPPADAPVRIDDLFYGDGGPTVVTRGLPPAERRDARFHQEIVTRAEHLQRLVADARAATDLFSRERARRALRDHVVTLESLARSFGVDQIAAYFADASHADLLADELLEMLERGARVLATRGQALDDTERELAILERVRYTPAAGTPAAPPHTPPGTSGAALQALLSRGLASLESLDRAPLSEPVEVEDDSIVPIERLLYRGRTALLRAVELRDLMRERGSTDPETLNELYELLDLARTE